MNMTRQEIFDKVATHLLKQNARSINSLHDCMYRGENGLKCAIGCLISDEKYTPEFEGKAVYLIVDVLGFDKNNLDIGNFLGSLQNIHDRAAPARWRDRLRAFAVQNGLNPGVCL